MTVEQLEQKLTELEARLKVMEQKMARYDKNGLDVLQVRSSALP